MKKMKPLLFLVLITLGISSCKKELQTVKTNVLVEIKRTENLGGNITYNEKENLSFTLSSVFDRDFYDVNGVNVSQTPITLDSMRIGDVRLIFLKDIVMTDPSDNNLAQDVVDAQIDQSIRVKVLPPLRGYYLIIAKRLDHIGKDEVYENSYSSIKDTPYLVIN